MKQFRNALDITVDNHSIIKEGYIQIPIPVKITEEWMRLPSITDEYDSNENSVLYPLHSFQITKSDLYPFLNRTIYTIPDDVIYSSYLESVRQNMILESGFLTDAEILDFLNNSDAYLEDIMNQYSAVSDILITRIWSYRLFERNQADIRYLEAYKTLCTVSALQLLLIISVSTPKFNLEICFTEQE